jgi:hypothetical protein
VLGILGEVALEFLVENLVPVIDIVDVLFIVYVKAFASELCPLLYLLLKIIRHLLHTILLIFRRSGFCFKVLFDPFEVSIV